MPEQLNVAVDDLTVGEIEKIEELAGVSIQLMERPEAPKGRLLRAIVCVMKQRTDPTFTWEQAGDIKINMIDATPDPTEANA